MSRSLQNFFARVRIYLDSSYEVRLAKHLDKSGISWVRKDQAFPYTDESGKNRKYTSDFFLLPERARIRYAIFMH